MMGYPVVVFTHHKVSELLEHEKYCSHCMLQYCTLLTYPDVTIVHCTTINPAESISFQFEGEAHKCVTESLAYSRLRPDLESAPLPEPEVTYFVNGSCYRDHEGNHAGYAVVKQGDQANPETGGTGGGLCLGHQENGKRLHRLK